MSSDSDQNNRTDFHIHYNISMPPLIYDMASPDESLLFKGVARLFNIGINVAGSI